MNLDRRIVIENFQRTKEQKNSTAGCRQENNCSSQRVTSTARRIDHILNEHRLRWEKRINRMTRRQQDRIKNLQSDKTTKKKSTEI